MQIEAISNPITGKENSAITSNPRVPDGSINTSVPRTSPNSESQLKQLQKELADNDIALSYRHDENSNRLVITLVDEITGETIRQIPDDVVLKLSSDIRGQFLNQTV